MCLAARVATEKGKTPERKMPQSKSIALQKAFHKIGHKNIKKLVPTVGKYSQSLDRALPGKHTRKLYDKLSRNQAAILSQLRTGKNKLNYYLAKAKIIESEVCQCERETETASHFLLRRPRWSIERAKMFTSAQVCTGDLSLLLGGWDPRTTPDRKKWQPNMTAVGAAIQSGAGYGSGRL